MSEETERKLLEACKAVLEWAYTDKWEPSGTFGYFAETVVPLVDDAVSRAESADVEETDEHGETPTMRADRLAWEAEYGKEETE